MFLICIGLGRPSNKPFSFLEKATSDAPRDKPSSPMAGCTKTLDTFGNSLIFWLILTFAKTPPAKTTGMGFSFKCFFKNSIDTYWTPADISSLVLCSATSFK